jgi:hypothetical protein
VPYDRERQTISMKDALDTWEPFAIAKLMETAKQYNATVTYGQVRDHVWTATGIRHDGLLSNWVGQLLNRVIKHCNEQGIPHLSSLVVKEDGTVGEGFRAALSDPEQARTLEDLDDLAAEMRLECYRHFGAELPPDGGKPTLTPKAKYTRDKKDRTTPPREMKQCPECFLTMPASGVCETCG